MEIKHLQKGTIVLGKVTSGIAGQLPANIILSVAQGELTDLDLKLNWVGEPVVMKSELDLKTFNNVRKAIMKHAKNWSSEDQARVECVVDALETSSNRFKFLKTDDPFIIANIQMSRKSGVKLSDTWY